MYEFRKLKPNQARMAFAIIEKRVAWMDDMGIRQWNATGYLTAYPLSHYIGLAESGRLYALMDGETAAATCAILTEDEFWADLKEDAALYVHAFASDPAYPGAGGELLNRVEDMARETGVPLVRLDCVRDNERLNRWYQDRGYAPNGSCVDGPYTGTRREKRVL